MSIEGRKAGGRRKKFLDELGYAGRYQAHAGDMFDFLYDYKSEKFDTVLCLGIYYHVMDHSHLLVDCRMRPETIIIDSGFVRSFRNTVHVQTEDPNFIEMLWLCSRAKRMYRWALSLWV